MAAIVKMKIKSERITSELTGTLPDAIDHLLVSSGDRASREKILAQLQATHQRVCEWEDERAKGG